MHTLEAGREIYFKGYKCLLTFSKVENLFIIFVTLHIIYQDCGNGYYNYSIVISLDMFKCNGLPECWP